MAFLSPENPTQHIFLHIYRKRPLLKRKISGTQGKDDVEFRTDPYFVGQLDFPPVIGDDAVGYGKTQAGPGFLGGKEGSEDFVQRFELNTAAGIGDLYGNRTLAVQPGRGNLNAEFAPSRHCFLGIDQQIEKNLLHLLAVSQQRYGLPGIARADSDAAFSQSRTNDRQALLEDVADVAGGITDGGLFGE